MKKNTYTRAYEACEVFFIESGQIPTIDIIKPLINVNSPTTISNAIKDWKQALSQSIRKNPGNNPGLPKPLMDVVNALWEQALAEAKNVLNEQAFELQGKQADLEAKELALDIEATRVHQLIQLTEQKFQEEINYLKKELNRITTESISLATQTECFRKIASENEKINAVLIEEVRQEKDKFARLERQYDKEHEWALKRIEEEKNNHQLQTHNEMQRLKSEATRSKQSSELIQAKLEIMLKQAIENRDTIIELERNLADEKLKLAGLTLNEAKLQKELNAKEERIRLLLNKTNKKGK